MSAKCHIYVQGIEMNCPLCKVPVKSGVVHECSLPEKKPEKKLRDCFDCGDGPCYMNCGPAIPG